MSRTKESEMAYVEFRDDEIVASGAGGGAGTATPARRPRGGVRTFTQEQVDALNRARRGLGTARENRAFRREVAGARAARRPGRPRRR